jgi:hypothetical protein
MSAGMGIVQPSARAVALLSDTDQESSNFSASTATLNDGIQLSDADRC